MQVWRAWNEGTVLEIIDSAISEHSEAVRCIHIGLLCVQEDAALRPIMSSVVQMLTSFSVTLPKPSAPPCSMSNTVDPHLQLKPSAPPFSMSNTMDPHLQLDSSTRRLLEGSINYVSITELGPR